MSNAVLAAYSRLASVVTWMLELARAREWAQLPDLDGQCTSIVDELRKLEPHDLAAEDRAAVVAVLTRIRSDQAELAALIRPQFTRLLRNIDVLQHQQQLERAYRH